jgi:Domain of unknown function (DUF4440)
MNRSIARTLAVLLAVLTCTSAVQATDSLTKDQETLMQRERDVAQAFVKGDEKVVAEWEAEEYVFTNFDGTVSDKAVDITGLRNGTLTFSKFDVDDMSAMVYGDWGVVVGRITQTGAIDKIDLSGVFRFPDTSVKRGGRL